MAQLLRERSIRPARPALVAATDGFSAFAQRAGGLIWGRRCAYVLTSTAPALFHRRIRDGSDDWNS